MSIKWSRGARADIVRLPAFLEPVAPEAAARVVQQLANAPYRVAEYPRIGEKLDHYGQREVRRIIVGRYEMRYEIIDATVVILRLWHSREERS